MIWAMKNAIKKRGVCENWPMERRNLERVILRRSLSENKGSEMRLRVAPLLQNALKQESNRLLEEGTKQRVQRKVVRQSIKG